MPGMLSDMTLLDIYDRLTAFIFVMLVLIAAFKDIGTRRVPNLLSLCLCLIGFNMRFLRGDLVTGVLSVAAVFVGTFLIWRLGFFGAGDAKLMTAIASILPPQTIIVFIICVGIFGGILGLVYLLLSKMIANHPHLMPMPCASHRSLLLRMYRIEFSRIQRRSSLPYAVAIAASTVLIFLRLPPW